MADEGLPVIAHFDVRRRSYVAADGSAAGTLPAFAAETGSLVDL